MSELDDVLKQIDEYLSELTDVDTDVRTLEVEKDVKIKDIVEEYAPLIDPKAERRDELVRLVTELYNKYRKELTEKFGKSIPMRYATLSARFAKASVVIEDETRAIRSIRRLRLATPALRRGKVTINKQWLGSHLDLVKRIKGLSIDRPENLTIKLTRTEVELVERLNPLRSKLT